MGYTAVSICPGVRVSDGSLPPPSLFWTRRDWMRALGVGAAGAACAGLVAPRAAAAASLSDPELMRAIADWTKRSALPIPMPTVKERALLLQGKVLKKWLPPRPGAPVGAMGMVVTNNGQAEMWLASADGEHMDAESDEGKLTAHNLPKKGNEMFRWYGFVDLPSPFSDRHFLIRTTVNAAACDNTDGRVWERTWDLEQGGVETMRPIVEAGGVEGLTVDLFDNAIYVPANMGGWISIRLPNGQTLFCYHASSSVGGDIPDKLVNRMVMMTLTKIMTDVNSFAGGMKSHYKAGHTAIMSGAGGMVPFF